MIGRRTLLKGVAVAGAAAAAGAPKDASASGARPHVQPDDVGMLFDTTLCIGCRGCVTKCKESNKLPVDRSQDGLYDAPDTLNGTTKNVIQVAQLPGDRWQFVKAQCMHCADPACVSVCMAHALHRTEGGIVAYNPSTCVGCRYCQVACPFDVPKFQWNQAFPLIVKCELCRHRADPKKEGPLAIANPACCETCPREAVIYGTMKDLKATAAKRMADAPERYNPKVFGEKDGGGTHVLYMTAKGVEFEQLGLPTLPEHGLPATAEKVQHTLYWGFIPPVALYAGLAYTIVKNKKKQAAEAGHGEEK
jgi:Fe-S-cluster-containing dehydrogenase component